MIELVILVLGLAGMVVAFLYVAKRAFSPKDIYWDRRSRVPLMRCRHCDEVVSRRTMGEHGENCPKRPDQVRP